MRFETGEPSAEPERGAPPGPRGVGLARKILLLLASLLFTALLLEGALQLASWVYRVVEPQGPVSIPEASRSGEYRILCIGESTTKGYGQTPYPKLLEEALNARDFGVTFRVINEGIVAAVSSRLARNLPGWLDEYDPHMVITMIGVNDQFFFSERERDVAAGSLQRLLLHSKLYRLLRLTEYNLGARLVESRYARSPWGDLEPDQKAFRLGARRSHRGLQKGTLEDPQGVLLALIEEGRALGRPATSRWGDTIAMPRNVLHRYTYLYTDLSGIYLRRGEGEKAVALYQDGIAAHPDVHYFYRGLSRMYDALGRDELAEEYRALSRQVAASTALAVTQLSYTRIASLLRERGVEFVAMQYPLRSAAELQSILADFEGVRYVENDLVFREAVDASSYESLFIDYFAGDFGHCSERGNRLIAENIVQTIFEPMFREAPAPVAP